MQIESTFTVDAPIDEVWDALMDFERVTSCVPGAEVLNKLSDDTYQVGMKVKLGPVSMQYRGQLTVAERDKDAYTAAFEGRAQETRGQGTAQGTAILVLAESAGQTQGSVTANVDLSGKVAAMGKSIIGGVTDQMMSLFAENLQTMLGEATGSVAESGAGAASEAESGAGAASQSESTPGSGSAFGSGSGSASSGPFGPGAASATHATAPTATRPVAHSSSAHSNAAHSSAAPGNSLDAFSLVRGMIMDQLSQPGRLIGIVAVVAFIAFRVGKRVGRKSVQ